MTFDSLLGNESIKNSLKMALTTRFPQAILLTGPEGSGKSTLAHIIASALLCDNNDIKPCDKCTSCHKINNSIHPDLTIIDENSQDIKVETARFLKSDCFILPNDSARKVYIIKHAQNINIQAQNILLKTLEEPPSFAFFILTCENENNLLPTIRSRVIKFALSPIDESDILSLLSTAFSDKSKDFLKPYAKKSNGIFGKALSDINNDIFDTQYNSIIKNFLKSLSECSEADMLLSIKPAEKISRKDFRNFLNIFKAIIHDIIFASNDLTDNCLPIFKDECTLLSRKIDSSKLFRLYDYVDSLDEKLNLNISISTVCTCLSAATYEICFLDT